MGLEMLWGTLQLHCTPPLRFVMLWKKKLFLWLGSEILLHLHYIALWWLNGMRTPVWYHKAKLPIAVYNCSQKVLHVSPNWVKVNWVKVSSRVQFIKVQPLTSCVSNTFCVPNFFPVKTLTEFGALEQKGQAKETLPDLWVCEPLFLGFL